MSDLEIMNKYYSIEIILKLYEAGIRFELEDGKIAALNFKEGKER